MHGTLISFSLRSQTYQSSCIVLERLHWTETAQPSLLFLGNHMTSLVGLGVAEIWHTQQEERACHGSYLICSSQGIQTSCPPCPDFLQKISKDEHQRNDNDVRLKNKCLLT